MFTTCLRLILLLRAFVQSLTPWIEISPKSSSRLIIAVLNSLCLSLVSNSYPKGLRAPFWKLHCSDFCHSTNTLTGISDLSLFSACLDNTTIIHNRFNITCSLSCLHATRYFLDKCHNPNSVALPQSPSLAGLSHCSHIFHFHLSGSNNILKAEVISVTLCLLKG